MDFWIANVADGSCHEEEWLEGYLSPWQRLMEYCKKQNTYITGLRLVMGEDTITCKPNAVGYWQAHGMPTVQGVKSDEELHRWRGVGWIEAGWVYIFWAARDPQTHQNAVWQDGRSAENQGQIIWSNKSKITELIDSNGSAEVRGIKKFSDKMVEQAGGVKELYIPGHHH